MRKTIGLLAIALALASSALAQEGTLIPYAFAWQPPVAGFNEVFRANGAPAAHIRHFGWGIELRSLVGKGLLLGPMFFSSTDKADGDSFQLSTGSTGLFGELGYRISIANVIAIVPMPQGWCSPPPCSTCCA